LPTAIAAPVIACFSIPESRNLKGLILIRFCLARDARASRLTQRRTPVARQN
jgi:hypothetical protein